jgi:hypothetical protein
MKSLTLSFFFGQPYNGHGGVKDSHHHRSVARKLDFHLLRDFRNRTEQSILPVGLARLETFRR